MLKQSLREKIKKAILEYSLPLKEAIAGQRLGYAKGGLAAKKYGAPELALGGAGDGGEDVEAQGYAKIFKKFKKGDPIGDESKNITVDDIKSEIEQRMQSGDLNPDDPKYGMDQAEKTRYPNFEYRLPRGDSLEKWNTWANKLGQSKEDRINFYMDHVVKNKRPMQFIKYIGQVPKGTGGGGAPSPDQGDNGNGGGAGTPSFDQIIALVAAARGGDPNITVQQVSQNINQLSQGGDLTVGNLQNILTTGDIGKETGEEEGEGEEEAPEKISNDLETGSFRDKLYQVFRKYGTEDQVNMPKRGPSESGPFVHVQQRDGKQPYGVGKITRSMARNLAEMVAKYLSDKHGAGEEVKRIGERGPTPLKPTEPPEKETTQAPDEEPTQDTTEDVRGLKAIEKELSDGTFRKSIQNMIFKYGTGEQEYKPESGKVGKPIVATGAQMKELPLGVGLLSPNQAKNLPKLMAKWIASEYNVGKSTKRLKEDQLKRVVKEALVLKKDKLMEYFYHEYSK